MPSESLVLIREWKVVSVRLVQLTTSPVLPAQVGLERLALRAVWKGQVPRARLKRAACLGTPERAR